MGKRCGGFGKLVRVVGRELARRGLDVHAIAWDEEGKQRVFELEGMMVHTYPYTWTSGSILRHLRDYAKVVPIIRSVNADVYISIDCMVETLIAEKTMPKAKHVIWVQDPFPYERSDCMLLAKVDPYFKQFNVFKFGLTLALYREAYKCADLILTQAHYFYNYKIKRLFSIGHEEIVYMPNPIEYMPPSNLIRKSDEPTVCFLGRLDPVKRYWIVFELAKYFPNVKFVIAGIPTLPLYESLFWKTVERYKYCTNLHLIGFVDGERKTEMLSRCWILLLPSIREALPLAFLEALAHKCALLSSVNPDNLVSRFGFYAKNDNFITGLQTLLSNDNWRIKGEKGYEYVRRVYGLDNVIKRLIGLLKV